jgi:hypothetical protein
MAPAEIGSWVCVEITTVFAAISVHPEHNSDRARLRPAHKAKELLTRAGVIAEASNAAPPISTITGLKVVSGMKSGDTL